VAKLIASEIESRPGLRRLQSAQTKRYDVAYEVIVPNNMDADTLVEKMNSIAVPGSSQSQAFRKALTSTDGVAQVGQIIVKMPARKFEESATTSPGRKPQEEGEEGSSWKSLVIGSVAIIMALLCGTATALLLKRKLQPFPASVPCQNMDADTNGCLDGVVLPVQEIDAEAGRCVVDNVILPVPDVHAKACRSPEDSGAIPAGQAVDAEADKGQVIFFEDVNAGAGEPVEVCKVLPKRRVIQL